MPEQKFPIPAAFHSKIGSRLHSIGKKRALRQSTRRAAFCSSCNRLKAIPAAEPEVPGYNPRIGVRAMAVATFDTLKFANTLKAAGVPEKQAEAQAVAFAEVVHFNLKELSTKDELERAIDDLRKDLRHDLKELEQRLAAKIESSDARNRSEQLLLRWMMGATFTGVVAALGLLGRLLFLMPR
jgi:hydroxylamine reductase (hybrid-cluster protein)